VARPRGKRLVGKEAGKLCQHWYDFIKPKRFFLKTKLWDGGCPGTKPGYGSRVWLGFDESGKERWAP
jgi:hypothetical protein